jgi:hypothetical protein
MARRIHMCLSVRGALNWPIAEQKRALKYLTRDDGTRFADLNEMRNALMDELQKGREVLPLTECDNFDFQKGCRGHEIGPAEANS